jgi:hypothetical protein
MLFCSFIASGYLRDWNFIPLEWLNLKMLMVLFGVQIVDQATVLLPSGTGALNGSSRPTQTGCAEPSLWVSIFLEA